MKSRLHKKCLSIALVIFFVVAGWQNLAFADTAQRQTDAHKSVDGTTGSADQVYDNSDTHGAAGAQSKMNQYDQPETGPEATVFAAKASKEGASGVDP